MDKREQGKKGRAAGLRFERRVRIDLEQKGWIVSKWFNNVELIPTVLGKPQRNSIPILDYKARLIPARHKFNGVGNPMSLGTGFPDFIAYKQIKIDLPSPIIDIGGIKATQTVYLFRMEWNIIGVESKSNGYLSKEEKLKCKWLLNNNIFSKILIAHKGKKRGVIEYKEWKIE